MGARDDQGFYQYAGPGKKRREKLSLKEIPRRFAKSRPDDIFGLTATRQAKNNEFSVTDAKDRIRRLLLDYNMSHADICKTMEREGYSITPIAISAVRSDMREVLRMLMREDIGLIDPEALERYRHKRSR